MRHQRIYLIVFVTLAVGRFAYADVVTLGDIRISFNDDVRPILNEHCIACHGGVKQAGDLSFVDSAASYVVEPGDPDASLLIERVTSSDPDERMPPPDHGKALTDSEVTMLRHWIEQGGQWGSHWAFVAPKPIEPPVLADDNWSRGTIDRFVLARIRQAGLSPSPDASPDRWLRRVTLDLTGLPPTPQERREFLDGVSDLGETAYANVVDRLLQSPSFGERWASVWLDAVRYADSKGLGIDGRRTIWKYRDWVIKAFNANMPYDQFTIKQIAGDLLPNPTIDDLVATACNRLTQTCEEGGTDDEQFRVEAVMDRVSTTMQTWQGLTFGCVQCHSHPYDPTQHVEYYQFMAFFNNTVDCDLDSEDPRLMVPLDDAQSEPARRLDEQAERLKHREWEEANGLLTDEHNWTPLQDFTATTDNSTEVVVESVAGFVEYQTRGTVAKNTTVIIESSLPENVDTITAIRFTGLPQDELRARADSEWGFVISHIKVELFVEEEQTPRELKIDTVLADEPDPILDPELSLDPKSDDGFGAYSRIHYPRSAAFLLAEPAAVPTGSRLRISLRQNIFALGAFPLVAHRGRLAVSNCDAITEWKNSDARAMRLQQLATIQEQRSEIPSVAIPITRERHARISRPTHKFERGNFLTKSDLVSAKTPDFLPSMPIESPTRLDLATWLASPQNPLTARVAVNRFWTHLFGTGLVATQEDFGSSGDPPSHPQLLDDLAARFCTDMEWDVKQLLRELTLSSTYRQTSAVDNERLAADPQNRLLSRGPRQRLPAETIRDQSLSIAGLLSNDPFGEPVHPPIPDGVWLPFQGGDKWATPETGDPDRYRRTIYTYTKRTIPFPMLASFDAPTREFCSSRRMSSNTPLQALMTLNDATFVEASEGLAKRMIEHHDKLRRQIRYGFLLAACRPPSNSEIDQLVALYNSSGDSNTPEGRQHVAMSTVASVLLNLDEVLSK